MLILNKPVVLLVKAANKIYDCIFFILGIFGVKPTFNSKDWYYQGVRLTEEMHKGIVEQMPDFEVHDSDIFQITYPRSGSNFTAEIIDAVLDKGDTSRLSNVHKVCRSPFIDFGHPYKYFPVLRLLLSAVGDVQKASRDFSGYYKSVKAPRFFRTHFPVQFAPKQLLAGKGKLVYIARNPKDVMISQWNLSNDINYFKYESWNNYCESFLNGTTHYGSWSSHVIGYWKYRNQKNVLFLKYEDIRADIRRGIRKLAEFLEQDLTDEMVEKIADQCSFENMKKNYMSYSDVLIPRCLKAKGKKDGGIIVRKGVVGGWKNILTEEKSKRIKEEYQRKVEIYGLTFDFGKN